MIRLFLTGGILLGLCPLMLYAQDTDGDGLPDAIEKRLGTDPQVDEQLVLLYDDKAQGQGDENISSSRRLAPDFTKVHLAHVAGNRYVWKIECAETYRGEGSIFHLRGSSGWGHTWAHGRFGASTPSGVCGATSFTNVGNTTISRRTGGPSHS